MTKTHKLTSFFQVVEKEARHSSDDLHSNSPPISSQSDTVQDKIFSRDDDDDDDIDIQIIYIFIHFRYSEFTSDSSYTK